MPEVTFSLWLALTVTVAIPAIMYCVKIHNMVKENLAMHKNPDAHGFGTTETNRLLQKHMRKEDEIHRLTIDTMNNLSGAVRELTHYIRWSTKQTTGKTAPPPLPGDHQR